MLSLVVSMANNQLIPQYVVFTRNIFLDIDPISCTFPRIREAFVSENLPAGEQPILSRCANCG